ncbi:hypothetical protein DFH08DRAFT_843173, partial [Mycena albidolilacea]
MYHRKMAGWPVGWVIFLWEIWSREGKACDGDDGRIRSRSFLRSFEFRLFGSTRGSPRLRRGLHMSSCSLFLFRASSEEFLADAMCGAGRMV